MSDISDLTGRNKKIIFVQNMNLYYSVKFVNTQAMLAIAKIMQCYIFTYCFYSYLPRVIIIYSFVMMLQGWVMG